MKTQTQTPPNRFSEDVWLSAMIEIRAGTGSWIRGLKRLSNGELLLGVRSAYLGSKEIRRAAVLLDSPELHRLTDRLDSALKTFERSVKARDTRGTKILWGESTDTLESICNEMERGVVADRGIEL